MRTYARFSPPIGSTNRILIRSFYVMHHGTAMNGRHELLEVLRQSRCLLALPGNDFSWSSWRDSAAALAELDERIAEIERGQLPRRLDLDVLYAPTGPMQEVSLSSGWAFEFLAMAERFDKAADQVWISGG